MYIIGGLNIFLFINIRFVFLYTGLVSIRILEVDLYLSIPLEPKSLFLCCQCYFVCVYFVLF